MMTTTPSTAAVSELERRRDVAARALEDAARRAAQGDDHASVDVERHADALRSYDESIAAAQVVARRGYAERTGRSFFGDLIRSAKDGDRDADRRLRELTTDYRSTTGNYGALVVPARLTAEVADSGQSRRPLADLVARPLPATGAPVIISKVSTGASAVMHATEGATITGQTDSATTETTLPIATVVDLVDLSEQVVARSDPADLDRLVAREVVGAVDARLEAQAINGSGSSGELRGLLNVTSAGSYTLTGTTAGDLLDAVARSSAASASASGEAADLVVMHPRRWAWLLANAGDYSGAITQATTAGPVAGRVLGMDVVASLGTPTTLGSSTNEDRVIVTRRDNIYLAETEPQIMMVKDANNAAGTLTSRLRVYRYVAAGVFKPTAVRIIAGAGVVDPYP